jgi:hypothetical protein
LTPVTKRWTKPMLSCASPHQLLGCMWPVKRLDPYHAFFVKTFIVSCCDAWWCTCRGMMRSMTSRRTP